MQYKKKNNHKPTQANLLKLLQTNYSCYSLAENFPYQRALPLVFRGHITLDFRQCILLPQALYHQKLASDRTKSAKSVTP